MKIIHWMLVSFLMAGISLSGYAEAIADKVQYQGKSKYIQITDIKVADKNGLLRLQVEFTNTNRSDRSAYYRIRWMDDSGFDVGGEEAWKPILIHGDQKQVVQTVAPSTQARDFRIQFNAEDNRSNDPLKQP